MKYRLALNAEKEIQSELFNQFDGVGMIRGEYPCRLIEQYYTLETCRKYIYDYIDLICKRYYPKEVWYRNSDFIVQEINVLDGADEIIDEDQYMLGLRGIRRGLKFEEVFRLEMGVIAVLSKKWDNLNILFSFVTDVNQFIRGKEILLSLGFKNHFGIMVEIPSTLFFLEEFIAQGVENFTIGVNDLTSLLLGTYRNSEYHNINHCAIQKVIKKCVAAAHKNNVTVSVAGIVNKEMENFCHENDVDWFIVNYSLVPDITGCNKEFLKEIEQLEYIKKLTKKRRVEFAMEKHNDNKNKK